MGVTIESERVGTGDPLARLILAARTGADGTFDALAEHISGRLMAFSRQMGLSNALAEDAVQETLLRVYRFLPNFSGGSFMAWCFRINNRVCCDLLRLERRQSAVPSPTVETHDPIDASDIRTVVERALRAVPEERRVAFLLRQQGLAYVDIATILRVPVGTVRSRLHEARRQLRDLLSNEFDWRNDR